jgi:hypothetical protein
MMHERLSKDEMMLLKGLAQQVAEIAADARWKQKEALWKKKNALQKTRPLVMCSPQGGWEDMIPPESYVIQDPLFGWYERNFKRLIYRNEHLRDDEVITNELYVPFRTHITDWIKRNERPYVTDTHRAGTFHPVILQTSDLQKMRYPELTVDEEGSEEDFQLAEEVFGEHLHVIQGEPFCSMAHGDVIGWGTSLVDLWCELRGMETVFFDFFDEPEFTKDAMQFLMEGTIRYLKEGERLGIWQLNNNGYVKDSNTPCGSNGLGYSDELPAGDYAGVVRLKDLWGYIMNQDLTPVSAQMLEEFVLPYQRQIGALFGLNCYGCCEVNDKKWELAMEYIPNLRELSVSPFSNFKTAVEKIEDRYVFCWKPNPSEMLATFDPNHIRKEMKKGMEMAKDCHLVVVLREIQTTYQQPQRLDAWVDITMELAEQYT